MDKDYTANPAREGLVRKATEAAHHARGLGTLRVHGKVPGMRIKGTVKAEPAEEVLGQGSRARDEEGAPEQGGYEKAAT